MISNTLNLKQLEALIWIAELGSFRRAARHLNTTQPNISARISRLEKSLGVRLMLRDAGSVRLTPKGAEFLEQARQVLKAAETLVEIADQPALFEDRLRLGVTELVACTWLRQFMRGMNEIYPNVAVELNIDLSRNLDKELMANRLDLAIQTAPFGSEATGVIELGLYPYVWVAAPEIAGRLPPRPTDSDLLSQTILAHARHTQAHLELTEKFGGFASPRARIAPSSSLTSNLHMVLDGMGIAPLPRAMVVGNLSDGSLVELDVSWRPSPLRFAARYQEDRAANYVKHAAELALRSARDYAAEDHQK